jgi:hypothetical protein
MKKLGELGSWEAERSCVRFVFVVVFAQLLNFPALPASNFNYEKQTHH